MLDEPSFPIADVAINGQTQLAEEGVQLGPISLQSD